MHCGDFLLCQSKRLTEKALLYIQRTHLFINCHQPTIREHISLISEPHVWNNKTTICELCKLIDVVMASTTGIIHGAEHVRVHIMQPLVAMPKLSDSIIGLLWIDSDMRTNERICPILKRYYDSLGLGSLRMIEANIPLLLKTIVSVGMEYFLAIQ